MLQAKKGTDQVRLESHEKIHLLPLLPIQKDTHTTHPPTPVQHCSTSTLLTKTFGSTFLFREALDSCIKMVLWKCSTHLCPLLTILATDLVLTVQGGGGGRVGERHLSPLQKKRTSDRPYWHQPHSKSI